MSENPLPFEETLPSGADFRLQKYYIFFKHTNIYAKKKKKKYYFYRKWRKIQKKRHVGA